jgi:hypothetical protein
MKLDQTFQSYSVTEGRSGDKAGTVNQTKECITDGNAIAQT